MGELSLEDWDKGRHCTADDLPYCHRCKPKPFPKEVFISGGGSAFHASLDCSGLRDGQRAIEQRGGTSAPVESVYREVGIGRGCKPCLLCFPGAKGHA